MAALAELGEIEEARAVGEKMIPLAEGLRQPYYSWMAALPKAMFSFLDKRADEIEPLIWRAAELGRQLESRVSRAFLGIQLTELRMIQGRYAELRAAAEKGGVTVPGAPDQMEWRGPTWLAGVAAVRCRLGLDSDARHEFEQMAVDDFADHPRDWTWLTAMEYLTEICAHLADARRATILYDQLLPYADRYVVIGHFGVPRGSVHRLLAALAVTRGDSDRAAEHFQAALAADETKGSPYAVAKCKYDYALALLNRAAPGDRDRADELLRDAQTTATRLGMGALETQLRELGHSGLTWPESVNGA
jgi:tetratricopeptide (TPR) repeat protein